PHFHWLARVAKQKISQRLQAAGYAGGNVQTLAILSFTPTGRADLLRINGTGDIVYLKAGGFRAIVDPERGKSSYWAGISQDKDFFQFHGRGWGHGAGLCQWGTKALAEKNLKYDQILRLYYRSVRLERREL